MHMPELFHGTHKMLLNFDRCNASGQMQIKVSIADVLIDKFISFNKKFYYLSV